MLGLYVTVPVACFRKGLAREYLETEPLPPPSTCYGFLLSLVGETQRSAHLGARVTAAFRSGELSTVLRTVWRIKSAGVPPGQGNNARPDYQQLLTGMELIIWLDSTEEVDTAGERLEARVRKALNASERGSISRFGGLSLGESSHLVNDVTLLEIDEIDETRDWSSWQIFLKREVGLVSLPLWVDHVGSAGTVHVTGDLKEFYGLAPGLDQMPKITKPF